MARAISSVMLAFLFASCAAAHKPTGTPAQSLSGPQSAALATSSRAVQPSSTALPVGAEDAVWGSPTAPVTLMEFSDLECPFCSRVHATLKQLQTQYGPTELRVVFKHDPLPFHPEALPAAKVADAVLRQGGARAFFAFLDLAFAEQTKLSDAALRDWIGRVGLDPALVTPRAELPDVSAKIAADIALASKVGATGTPAFRINGTALVGAQPLDAFTSIIDAELVAAADLVKKGTPPGAVYGARVAANYTETKPEPDDEPDEDLTIWKMPVQGAPAVGPKDALVTVVEFFDYQCPFCRRVEATMHELLARYPKDLRIVLRQNPLPFHARALPAANLAFEARAQQGDAGFLAANRALFEDKYEKLSDADLLQIGKDLKLDAKRVQAAISSNKHAKEVEADSELASDFKAFGTPCFFINGLRLSGAQPLDSFVTLIEAQLKVANALVSAGTPRAAVYEEIMKRAKEPDPPEQKSMPAPTAENPSRGPLNAPIVIHEFADFQCPFCGRVESTLAQLDAAFPNQLRWVWHDYPLPFHDKARGAAIIAREVRAQKGDAGFWKIHDRLFGDQGLDNALEPAMFDKYALELNLDRAKLAAAESDGRYDAVLGRDVALARQAGINGTPAFVINGYYMSGAQPLSAFKRTVRYALAHSSVRQAAPARLGAAPEK